MALARATWQTSKPLAVAWWGLVIVRGVLPAALTLGLGALLRAVESGAPTGPSLAVVAGSFAILGVATPIHTQVGAILGDRTSGLLQARLTSAVSDPPGIAHLERPKLADELVNARDFDLGIIGPPISVSMGFIASGLVALLSGASQAVALATVTWWGALVIAAAWLSTHWLLRESSFWQGRSEPEVQAEQRHADYSYRLAVEAGPAKEVRVFGLGEWVVDRFALRRRRLLDMQWNSMRLRQRSLVSVLVVLVAAHAVVLIPLILRTADGDLALDAIVVAAQALIGAAALAVGDFTWALDAAATPVKAVEGLAARMAPEGDLSEPPDPPGPQPTDGLPAHEIRFRELAFTYPSGGPPVYEGLDLTIPAGQSTAIVGRNGVGKTTLVKLLCRLYDPTSGSVEIDGVDLRSFDIEQWRARVAVVFQDFVRFELSLRDNLVPARAAGMVDDDALLAALETAGARDLAALDQALSKAYTGGTDLSGGQWQRIALARALAAVHLGAGVVVLDEPTAQLDVRGEAEIFERLLSATEGCTTILISHRFSTVRRADRIVVIDEGQVVEAGSHDDLMAANGQYRTMFDLQAARFEEDDEDGEGQVKLS